MRRDTRMIPMKKRIAAVVLGLLGLALLSGIYAAFIEKDMSDFGVPYRNAGRILRGETLYRVEDGHLQYKYAPVSALFYAPLVFLPYPAAKIVWFFLEIAFLAGICTVGWTILPVKRKGPLFVLGFGLLAMLKLLGRELQLGQVNLLILLLLLLMTSAASRRKDAVAGALWAASIFIKPYALIFLPYFALKRRGKALLAGAAVLLAGLAAPIFFYGFRGNLNIHREWISRLSDSTPGLLAVGDNASLYAFLLKLFPGATEAALKIAWLAAGGIVAGLFLWMMRRAKEVSGSEILEASFLLVLIPFFSPLGWYYNYLYALPALFVALNAWPLLSAPWKWALAVDLVLIGGTLREVLGKTLFRIYTSHSLIVLNFLVLLVVLAHVRRRRIA
jgi:hypothetical protein